MPLILTAAHHSQEGLRDHNEDVVGMVTPPEPIISTKGMIAAVADGVSGSTGGREAAEYAVGELLTNYYTTPDDWPVTQALDHVVTAINRRVQGQESLPAKAGRMATTLTALVIRSRSYYFAHVGDSRLYLLRNGLLKSLTTDHVWDSPEKRHVLTRAIGLGSPLTIDRGMGELQAGDIFLLASDGVWGALPEHELSWHLGMLADRPESPEATAKLLVDAALAAGSRDNASALVVRIAQLPEEAPLDASPDSQPLRGAKPIANRDPFLPWKIVGAISLVVNLWLLYLLMVG